MPTLNWIGKEKVVNHHMDVPYRPLKKQYTFNAEISDNMIIHGDNLEALKALLPKYEGKVDVIYIDPPYNTGNEGWVYNDNVNDPRIRRWLGQVVGPEGEDLCRHDKWLCMMYPRLVLLQKLLSSTGFIFISIDDNERSNLQIICEEIFGRQMFVADIPWRKRTAKSDVPFGISSDYEHILCFAGGNDSKAAIVGEERKYYETKDYPGEPWRFHDLTKQTTIEERPNSNFTIVNPKNGEQYPVNPLRSWAITKDTFQKYYNENRIIFPGDYDFLKISKPVLRYWKKDDIAKAGSDYGLIAASTQLPSSVGMTQDGTKELTSIFGSKVFNFPKPSSLIQYLINIATITKRDALILDSFAGSGTTAHAVLNLNKEDGGKRKFILCEMCDYAETTTAERVRRVINGYGEGNKAVPGTGGDFSFYELGEPIIKEGSINPDVTEEELRKFIYYSETRTDLPEANPDDPTLMGVHNGIAFYLHYSGNCCSILDRDYLRTLKTKADSYVIYAGRCTLSEAELEKFGITFKKTSRDVRAF